MVEFNRESLLPNPVDTLINPRPSYTDCASVMRYNLDFYNILNEQPEMRKIFRSMLKDVQGESEEYVDIFKSDFINFSGDLLTENDNYFVHYNSKQKNERLMTIVKNPTYNIYTAELERFDTSFTSYANILTGETYMDYIPDYDNYFCHESDQEAYDYAGEIMEEIKNSTIISIQ